MKTRRLGQSGLAVSAMGLGCTGMSEFYGQRDDREALATIHRANRGSHGQKNAERGYLWTWNSSRVGQKGTFRGRKRPTGLF